MQTQPTVVFASREEYWRSLPRRERARRMVLHGLGGVPETLWARRAKELGEQARHRGQLDGGVTGPELRALVKQHRSRCAYCRRRLSFYGLRFRVSKLWALKVLHRPPRHWADAWKRGTFDHVVPITWGGEHDISNLVPACRACNYRRAPTNPIRVAALAVELLSR